MSTSGKRLRIACRRCVFFVISDDMEVSGECWFNPPTVNVTNGGESIDYVRPSVMHTDFCGHFSRYWKN